MNASDRQYARNESHDELAALERGYQLFDRAGLLELFSAHPSLHAALGRLRVAIGTCVGTDAVALVDTVRSARTGHVVGVVLMVQPSRDSRAGGFERLSRWWHRRGASDARARIALGVLPARSAANDNAFDDG